MPVPELSEVELLVRRVDDLERGQKGVAALLQDVTKTQAVQDARIHAVEVTTEANRELMDHLTGRVAQLRDLIGEKFEDLVKEIGGFKKEVAQARKEDAEIRAEVRQADLEKRELESRESVKWMRGILVSIFLALFSGIVVTQYMS